MERYLRHVLQEVGLYTKQNGVTPKMMLVGAATVLSAGISIALLSSSSTSSSSSSSSTSSSPSSSSMEEERVTGVPATITTQPTDLTEEEEIREEGDSPLEGSTTPVLEQQARRTEHPSPDGRRMLLSEAMWCPRSSLTVRSLLLVRLPSIQFAGMVAAPSYQERSPSLLVEASTTTDTCPQECRAVGIDATAVAATADIDIWASVVQIDSATEPAFSFGSVAQSCQTEIAPFKEQSTQSTSGSPIPKVVSAFFSCGVSANPTTASSSSQYEMQFSFAGQNDASCQAFAAQANAATEMTSIGHRHIGTVTLAPATCWDVEIQTAASPVQSAVAAAMVCPADIPHFLEDCACSTDEPQQVLSPTAEAEVQTDAAAVVTREDVITLVIQQDEETQTAIAVGTQLLAEEEDGGDSRKQLDEVELADVMTSRQSPNLRAGLAFFRTREKEVSAHRDRLLELLRNTLRQNEELRMQLASRPQAPSASGHLQHGTSVHPSESSSTSITDSTFNDSGITASAGAAALSGTVDMRIREQLERMLCAVQDLQEKLSLAQFQTAAKETQLEELSQSRRRSREREGTLLRENEELRLRLVQADGVLQEMKERRRNSMDRLASEREQLKFAVKSLTRTLQESRQEALILQQQLQEKGAVTETVSVQTAAGSESASAPSAQGNAAAENWPSTGPQPPFSSAAAIRLFQKQKDEIGQLRSEVERLNRKVYILQQAPAGTAHPSSIAAAPTTASQQHHVANKENAVHVAGAGKTGTTHLPSDPYRHASVQPLQVRRRG